MNDEPVDAVVCSFNTAMAKVSLVGSRSGCGWAGGVGWGGGSKVLESLMYTGKIFSKDKAAVYL